MNPLSKQNKKFPTFLSYIFCLPGKFKRNKNAVLYNYINHPIK